MNMKWGSRSGVTNRGRGQSGSDVESLAGTQSSVGVQREVPAGVGTMNGLRVYVNQAGPETRGGHGIFYSRRDDGPFYRWFFEEKIGAWRVARVQASDFSPKALSTANWKGVPVALQRSMGEHYQE